MNCSLKRRDDEVAATSGIAWCLPEQIDWNILCEGIRLATQRCFTRIAVANQSRTVEEVVVAYRVGEGVRIEPCVTFSDGEYLNASLNDDILFDDLEPFDNAFTRIEEELEDHQIEEFIELLESKIPDLMKDIFESLQKADFGLELVGNSTRTLKEF